MGFRQFLSTLMTQKEFLKDLQENIYCRLQPSSLHGIGIFAIRDIPKGADPFPGCRMARWREIPLERFQADDKIPAEVKQFAQAIFPVRGKTFYFPDHSLNAIDISYFLNHADAPNVGARADGNRFVALRDIKKRRRVAVRLWDVRRSLKIFSAGTADIFFARLKKLSTIDRCCFIFHNTKRGNIFLIFCRHVQTWRMK